MNMKRPYKRQQIERQGSRTLNIALLIRSDLMSPLFARLVMSEALLDPEDLQAI